MQTTIYPTNQKVIMNFISLDGFSADKVHIPNRKKIMMAMDVLNSIDDSKKEDLYHYIEEYCPDIKQSDNCFCVKSNEDLSLVLYGIGERFYTTQIGEEKRIANSVIKLK